MHKKTRRSSVYGMLPCWDVSKRKFECESIHNGAFNPFSMLNWQRRTRLSPTPYVLSRPLLRECRISPEIRAPMESLSLSLLSQVRLNLPTLGLLKQLGNRWRSLVRDVAQQVRAMPLFRLQIIGRREVDFLYANHLENGAIVLRKGVQNCFRRFYGIILRLSRREWFEMVCKLNPTSIGAPFGPRRIHVWQRAKPMGRGSARYSAKSKAGNAISPFKQGAALRLYRWRPTT